VARSLIFQVPNSPQGHGYIIPALLIIQDRSRRRFDQIKLVAYFLEARSESFNLFLLPGYGRFLRLDLALLFQKRPVFFKEFVKQHRIHRLVTHGDFWSSCY
jgi:hypothetical protein